MSKSDSERFICCDCGKNTHVIQEYYMVNDVLWKRVMKSDMDRMACIGCFEVRLGRQLNPSDFTDCPLNNRSLDWNFRSERLNNRLGFGG